MKEGVFHVEHSAEREDSVGKIVAVANQKGGVGKTTTAVNLSACVAALGKKVLIVDLDPQGNSTTGYGISKRSVEMGTYEVLIGEAPARDAIRKTNYRADVLPSNTRLAGAGLELIDLPGRESRLRKGLAPIQQDYDYIFIDCPPSLVLRGQGLPDHHPPDHPHLGGAQLRPAHQLLRAQGEGQRGLYGPCHRVRQAEPPAGPPAPPPPEPAGQNRGICKDAPKRVRRVTDAKRKRWARPRAGEPV